MDVKVIDLGDDESVDIDFMPGQESRIYFDGVPGPAGRPGDKGDKGDTGGPGPQGEQGPIGPQADANGGFF